jgi:putative glutamine amidotransferase
MSSTSGVRLLISCKNKTLATRHCVPAIHVAGWHLPIQLVHPGDPAPNFEGVVGLLLTGGGDIHPRHWDEDEPVHPKAQVDEARDQFELPLIREAWERNLPILGICRGGQMVNIALGGSLIQDVPEYFGCNADLHQHGDSEVPEVRHPVSVTHNSRLFHLMGGASVPVNSRHHQAVRNVAPDMRAVAFHAETLKNGVPLIEAIEAKDPDRWVIGVQWHPENLVEMGNHAGSAARGLFHGFVQALQDSLYKAKAAKLEEVKA